jgi:hypothetical protein
MPTIPFYQTFYTIGITDARLRTPRQKALVTEDFTYGQVQASRAVAGNVNSLLASGACRPQKTLGRTEHKPGHLTTDRQFGRSASFKNCFPKNRQFEPKGSCKEAVLGPPRKGASARCCSLRPLAGASGAALSALPLFLVTMCPLKWKERNQVTRLLHCHKEGMQLLADRIGVRAFTSAFACGRGSAAYSNARQIDHGTE